MIHKSQIKDRSDPLISEPTSHLGNEFSKIVKYCYMATACEPRDMLNAANPDSPIAGVASIVMTSMIMIQKPNTQIAPMIVNMCVMFGSELSIVISLATPASASVGNVKRSDPNPDSPCAGVASIGINTVMNYNISLRSASLGQL